MYTGHAAIALVLKARRPNTPMLPLMLAAYGPDWIDLALMIPKPREGMGPWSHSIPAVLLGAFISAVLYEALYRREGAVTIAIAWLMHWPADLLTGIKPLMTGAHSIGLDAYHLPALDLVLETLVASLACLNYATTFADTRARRRMVAVLWIVLVALQAVFVAAVSRWDPNPWRPSLAEWRRRPHVIAVAGAVRATDHCRMALALLAFTHDGARHVVEGTNRGGYAGLPDLREREVLHA